MHKDGGLLHWHHVVIPVQTTVQCEPCIFTTPSSIWRSQGWCWSLDTLHCGTGMKTRPGPNGVFKLFFAFVLTFFECQTSGDYHIRTIQCQNRLSFTERLTQMNSLNFMGLFVCYPMWQTPPNWFSKQPKTNMKNDLKNTEFDQVWWKKWWCETRRLSSLRPVGSSLYPRVMFIFVQTSDLGLHVITHCCERHVCFYVLLLLRFFLFLLLISVKNLSSFHIQWIKLFALIDTHPTLC